MDIVTHGMMGVIIASPFMPGYPVAASCFMMGSVLPDLDAFSRVLGKRVFLKSHQTYTHAIPIILLLGGIGWAGIRWAGFHAPFAPAALVLGMLFHAALDVTNTYGITLFAPFSRRRFCLEWVFFIDASVLAATLPTVVWVGWQWSQRRQASWTVAVAYVAVLAGYWLSKIALRRRARRSAPDDTLALLPSALVPWSFLGCARTGTHVRLFRINALSGVLIEEGSYSILDPEWLDRVADVPEVQVMRELSPAYHVVEIEKLEDGTAITLRDLRTRNFKTSFGELRLVLGPDGTVRDKVFHV